MHDFFRVIQKTKHHVPRMKSLLLLSSICTTYTYTEHHVLDKESDSYLINKHLLNE